MPPFADPPETADSPTGLQQFVVPDLWQQKAVSALRAGKDVVIHAPTGAGKTLVFELWSKAGKNRGQAIDAVMKRDKLLNPKIERARMDWVIDRLIRTENVRNNGLGAFEMKRVADSIAVLADGLGLDKAPTPQTLLDLNFMPPASERIMG